METTLMFYDHVKLEKNMLSFWGVMKKRRETEKLIFNSDKQYKVTVHGEFSFPWL